MLMYITQSASMRIYFGLKIGDVFYEYENLIQLVYDYKNLNSNEIKTKGLYRAYYLHVTLPVYYFEPIEEI